MKAKLKEGITIQIAIPPDCQSVLIFDKNTIFTDKTESGLPIYVNGMKMFFPIDHYLSGGGYSEDLFDIIDKDFTYFDGEII